MRTVPDFTIHIYLDVLLPQVLFSRPGGIKMGSSNGNKGDGMMGGGNNGGNANNNGQGAFSADGGDGESNSLDALALLGVLATVQDGLGGVWDSYNDALSENPILVKVSTFFRSA